MRALQRLNEACEKAKIELSTTLQSEINLPFITARMEGGSTTPLHLVETVRGRGDQCGVQPIDAICEDDRWRSYMGGVDAPAIARRSVVIVHAVE